jgi:hypothetical protein
LADGFTLVGEKASGTFVATIDASAPCEDLSNQSIDVFAAAYLFNGVTSDYQCRWVTSLGSSGNDVAEDAHMDALGNAYVAASFPNDFGFPAQPGPYVARLGTLTGFRDWATSIGTAAHTVYALGGDGLALTAGGRAGSGYGVDVDVLLGAAGTYRIFTGAVDTRGVDAAGEVRAAGGSWTGTAEFGGTFPPRSATGRDGFVIRYLAP